MLCFQNSWKMVQARIKLIFFLIIPLKLFSQGEFNNWYFGDHAGVTFASGYPVALTNSAMFCPGVSISISDSSGNLWFYSDAFHVYNKNHSLMPNGSGLFGPNASYSQHILAVQKISDDSSFYIFTTGQFNPFGISLPVVYSMLNMRLDGGLGDIEPGKKNIPLPYATTGWCAITGTRHQNNKDVWVVLRLANADSNFFVSYFIDESGLDTIPIFSYSSITELPFPIIDIAMNLNISPDGSKLVCRYTSDTCEFCNFNKIT